MNYLPSEKIIYKTRLKEEEVIRRLSDILEPEKIFRFGVFISKSTKTYEGQIDGRTFSIKRIIRYRNSFLPRINGTIESDYDGSTINVKMRLNIFAIVFLSIWYGVAGLGLIAFLAQTFANSEFNATTLIPFSIILFAYGLTMAGFKFESKKSKNDLKRIFDAEIIKD